MSAGNKSNFIHFAVVLVISLSMGAFANFRAAPLNDLEQAKTAFAKIQEALPPGTYPGQGIANFCAVKVSNVEGEGYRIQIDEAALPLASPISFVEHAHTFRVTDLPNHVRVYWDNSEPEWNSISNGEISYRFENGKHIIGTADSLHSRLCALD